MSDENSKTDAPVKHARVKVRPGVTVYAGGGSHGFEAGSELTLPEHHVADLEADHVERVHDDVD